MEPYILIENDIVLKMIANPQLFIGYNERQNFCTIHQNIYSICKYISDHLDRCPQPPKKLIFEETNISDIITIDMKQCSIGILKQFSVYLSLFFIAITLRRLKCSSYLILAAHLPSFWYVCEGVGDYEINYFKWLIDRQKFVNMNLEDSI